jgi:predicted DNA-binding transcriptional regulator AlpA
MSVHVLPIKHHLDRRAVALIEAATEGTDDELLNTPALAKWLDVSEQWLEIGRSRGWGPKFVKLSPRRVRYRRGDVLAWLAERTYAGTAEYDTPDAGQPAKSPEPRRQRVCLGLDDDDDAHLPPRGAA